MNFIIRNLGWILLIIFFVFMLYLISNQNNTKNNVVTNGTGITLMNSGASLSENASDEINQIANMETVIVEDSSGDEKENTPINELANTEEEDSDDSEVSMADTSSGSMMNSLRDFFTIKKSTDVGMTESGATLTGADSSGVDKNLIKEVESELDEAELQDETGLKVMTFDDKISDADVLNEENVEEDATTELNDEDGEGIMSGLTSLLGLNNKELEGDEGTELKEENDDVAKVTSLDADEGVKNELKEDVVVDNIEMSKDESKQIKVNKDTIASYTIGVDSMFLNNAWFTERTGVVYRGDRVDQLTNINQYGCFKIRVAESKNTKNNGKIGWACKYYMKGHTESIYAYEGVANDYYKNTKASTKKTVTKPVVKTQTVNATRIGTIYTVETYSLKLNNESFTQVEGYVMKGDKLEQITEVNNNGCFKASVYASTNVLGASTGKRGWVCQRYLK